LVSGGLGLVYYQKQLSQKNSVVEVKVTDHDFSYCSRDNECFLYEYSECSCSSEFALNKKYERDTDLLKKTFGPTGRSCSSGTCGMTFLNASGVRCVNKKCAVEYKNIQLTN